MKPNRIPMQFNLKTRSAFTLVELMVAMAIIILMLSIMSQAFVIATGAMQGLKEAADMHEKVRPVITLLQRDLGALHFDGSRKLSDSNFWDSGPPKEGYFMLWQDSASDSSEGSANNVSFCRSAALANHMLAFSVKLAAKTPDDYFQTSILNLGGAAAFNYVFHNLAGTTPPKMMDANARRFETNSTIIKSDWAEVAYFLGPHTNNGLVTQDGATDGKTGPPTVSPLPYFNLYRQQRLVLPSNNISGVTVPTFQDTNVNRDLLNELSYHPENTATPPPPPPILKFNTPSDLTVPWKRMGNRTSNNGPPANYYLGKPPANTPLFSEYTSATKQYTDIIATNVISFDVKLLTDDQYDYETLFTILNRNPYFLNPAVGNYLPSAVFDTWTTDQGNAANSIPKYDLGEWNTITNKWQPSIPTSNATIPVWGCNQASANPADKKPYKGIQIKALQISIRIWDQKSNSAKMFVIVQKL